MKKENNHKTKAIQYVKTLEDPDGTLNPQKCIAEFSNKRWGFRGIQDYVSQIILRDCHGEALDFFVDQLNQGSLKNNLRLIKHNENLTNEHSLCLLYFFSDQKERKYNHIHHFNSFCHLFKKISKEQILEFMKNKPEFLDEILYLFRFSLKEIWDLFGENLINLCKNWSRLIWDDPFVAEKILNILPADYIPKFNEENFHFSFSQISQETRESVCNKIEELKDKRRFHPQIYPEFLQDLYANFSSEKIENLTLANRLLYSKYSGKMTFHEGIESGFLDESLFWIFATKENILKEIRSETKKISSKIQLSDFLNNYENYLENEIFVWLLKEFGSRKEYAAIRRTLLFISYLNPIKILSESLWILEEWSATHFFDVSDFNSTQEDWLQIPPEVRDRIIRSCEKRTDKVLSNIFSVLTTKEMEKYKKIFYHKRSLSFVLPDKKNFEVKFLNGEEEEKKQLCFQCLQKEIRKNKKNVFSVVENLKKPCDSCKKRVF